MVIFFCVLPFLLGKLKIATMDDYLNAPNIKIGNVYYAVGQHPTDVITLIPDTQQFCFEDYS